MSTAVFTEMGYRIQSWKAGSSSWFTTELEDVGVKTAVVSDADFSKFTGWAIAVCGVGGIAFLQPCG